MEKQTIGQFLSALRRSNGYTQQDVAEKLGVSNKTVSCWERDAYSPDIATIPALAELYGVTCDEILRAKRAPATDAAEGYEDEKARSYAFKAEKEASAIFENRLARYDNTHKTAIACIIFAAVAAVILAIVVEQATQVRLWAFAVAAPLLCVCIFLLLIINYRLNFAVSDDERAFETRKRMYRRKNTALNFLTITLCSFLPCAMYLVYNFKYYLYGVAFAVISAMFVIIAELVRRIRKPQYYKPFPLKAKIFLLTVYVVLFISALVSTYCYGLHLIRTKQLYDEFDEKVVVFKDIDELAEYMEIRTLPDCYKELSSKETDYRQLVTYEVSASDFNEADLEPFASYSVISKDGGQTYLIYMLYDTLNLDYTYTDEESGEKMTGTRRIVIYNENYTASYLKPLSDGTYEMRTVLHMYYEQKYSRANDKNDYDNLLFGAIAAASALTLFGAICLFSYLVVKKRNKPDDGKPQKTDNLEG